MYGTATGVTGRAAALNAFTASTTPALAQVESWLTEASAMIDGAIAARGYSLPVPGGAVALDIFAGLAETYAAAQALRSRGIGAMSGTGQQSQSAELMADWRRGLEDLRKADLKALGIESDVVSTARRNRRRRSGELRRIDGYANRTGGEFSERSDWRYRRRD